MFNYSAIVVICWMAFLSYWAVSAIYAKKTKRSAWKWFGARAVIIIGFFLLFHSQIFHNAETLNFVPTGNSVLGFFGALFTVVGISIAIWARYHLGRNWGMPMTVKEHPDLIETGPYAHIRHPIYSGVLLAILGSTLLGNVGWLIIFIISTVYFVYNAKQEELLMSKEFPLAYNEYKKKTKMLIPFLY